MVCGGGTLPRKSEHWIKTVNSNGGSLDSTDVITRMDMVSDLSYAKTIDVDGSPINSRWLVAVEEPDLCVMVLRESALVITYRRKEDE
jgi:hypothetical protein